MKKRGLYEEFGILEYWIVDPVQETVTVYRLAETRYERSALWSAESTDAMTSPLLPGLSPAVTEVFEG